MWLNPSTAIMAALLTSNWISVKEAVDRLRCTHSQLERHVECGRIRGRKDRDGQLVAVHRRDIERLVRVRSVARVCELRPEHAVYW